MAEEALDLEGEGMKGFWSGFWRGFLSAFLMFVCIGTLIGAIWLLAIISEGLMKAYGEMAAIIMLVALTIIGAGVFQGCWVYKRYRHYKKIIKDLEVERIEDPDPSCDYDYVIASVENKIKSLLNGDYYYEVCR